MAPEIARAANAAEHASFGAWLKEHRRKLGLTQKELGRHIGCSESALRKYESAARRPTRQIVERIADHFELLPEQRGELLALAGLGAARKLPARLTPLIGREKEVAQARTFLLRDDMRLLTLTGPPGVGKTRLATQVAAGLLDNPPPARRQAFADGVFFVDLAPVRDPGLVLDTIAQAVGVRQGPPASGYPGTPEGEVMTALAQELHAKRVLLLLDNFEQVSRASPLVVGLLEECPNLKALVTSREVLRVRGEQQLIVPALALPDLVRNVDAQELQSYPAVRLFVERAGAVDAGFALTPENASSVAAICVRLEGLPLAIELAAAHSGMLTPAQMLAQLQSRLSLLSGGARDLPARHQTLHDAIAWSYDLLDSPRQELFASLSVFVGGFTLEAAEEVCTTHDLLPCVRSLLEASLLQRLDSEDEARFRMLETIREYATEKLEATGRAGELRKLHAAYYRDLAERVEVESDGPEQAACFDKLEQEQENIRAALDWSLQTGESENAARTAGALTRFWGIRGYWSEGRRWVEQCLNQSGSLPMAVRAKLTFGAGRLASLQDDYERAGAFFGEALALYREIGDRRGMTQPLNGLALLAALRGDSSRARALLEERLTLGRALGDKQVTASTLNNLGQQAASEGEYERSAALLQEAAALFGELDDKAGMAEALENLGQLSAERGDYGKALSLLEECLARNIELGDRAHIAWVQGDIGVVALAAGDYSRSIDSTRRAIELFREMGDQRGLAVASFILGVDMFYVREYDEATRCFKENITLCRDSGDEAGSAQGLDGLASVAGARGAYEMVAQLLGAAQRIRDDTGAGYRVRPIEQPLHETSSAAAAGALGEEIYSREYQQGYSLPAAEALEIALRGLEAESR